MAPIAYRPSMRFVCPQPEFASRLDRHCYWLVARGSPGWLCCLHLHPAQNGLSQDQGLGSEASIPDETAKICYHAVLFGIVSWTAAMLPVVPQASPNSVALLHAYPRT